MISIYKVALYAVFALALIFTALTTHLSGLSMQSMDHNDSILNSCTSICNVGVIKSNSKIAFDSAEEDDTDPTTPFEVTAAGIKLTSNQHSERTKYSLTLDLPPREPPYILLGVFRV